jgi:hypothetical protein
VKILRSDHSLNNHLQAALLRTLQPVGAECRLLLGNCYAADVTELRSMQHNLPEKDRATGHHDVHYLSGPYTLSIGNHSRSQPLAAENHSSAHCNEHSTVPPRIRPAQDQEP